MQESPILFTWKDRAAKVTDGVFFFSRAGDHADWDCFPAVPDPKMPFLGVCDEMGEPVQAMEKLDEDRVRITTTSGRRYLMIGDPADGGRIEPEQEA